MSAKAVVRRSCCCCWWLFTETDRSGGSGLVRVPVGEGSDDDDDESPPTVKSGEQLCLFAST